MNAPFRPLPHASAVVAALLGVGAAEGALAQGAPAARFQPTQAENSQGGGLRTFYRQIPQSTPDSDRQFTYIECAVNLSNVVDHYGRPWAQAWDSTTRRADKPVNTNGVGQDVLDLFK